MVREFSSKPLSTWVAVTLCILSGCMWFLACANFDIWPLAWIAQVPTMIVVERAETNRRGFLYGWLTGIVGNIGGFYWIEQLLTRFANMPRVVGFALLLLMGLYQGLVFAFAAYSARLVRSKTQQYFGSVLPMTLVAPLTFVTFELVTPMIFPFYVAITQAWQHHVIQVADMTGPLGVTALLLMFNGAIYDVAVASPRRVKASAVGAGILLASLGYGHFRIKQVERLMQTAPTFRVGLVQPNVGFGRKGVDHREFAITQLQELHRMSERLENQGAQLIIWPESSYPYPLLRSLQHDFPTRHDLRIRRGFTVPLIFGALTLDRFEQHVRPYNSALVLERDGRLSATFDKIFLLVFGEYVPLRDQLPFLEQWMPDNAGQLARGQSIHTLPFEAPDGRRYRLGPLICYEDIVPEFALKLAPMHPHLLVNVTNDSWFGDTSEPWEHLALSVYRSVEIRTGLVRAVNTGVSAFIDPAGRVYNKTYANDPTVSERPVDGIVDNVKMIEGGYTIYAKVGNLFGYLCTLATAVLLFVVPRLKPKKDNSQQPT